MKSVSGTDRKVRELDLEFNLKFINMGCAESTKYLVLQVRNMISKVMNFII